MPLQLLLGAQLLESLWNRLGISFSASNWGCWERAGNICASWSENAGRFERIQENLQYCTASAAVLPFLASQSIFQISKSPFTGICLSNFWSLFPLCKWRQNINCAPLVSWSARSEPRHRSTAGLLCKLSWLFLHLCFSELLCKLLECNFYIYSARYATPLCSDAKGIWFSYRWLLGEVIKRSFCGKHRERSSEKQWWQLNKTRTTAYLKSGGGIKMFPSYKTTYSVFGRTCDYCFSTTWLRVVFMEVIEWLNMYICFTTRAQYILHVLLVKHTYW